MKNLKVPYGLTQFGTLHTPENSNKNEIYFCPSCKSKLTLKIGTGKIIKHFSHPKSSTCTQESIIHATSKNLLANRIIDGQNNHDLIPQIFRMCKCCHKSFLRNFPIENLTVKIESPINPLGSPNCLIKNDGKPLVPLNNGCVVDIGLFRGHKLVAAIEIKVTHAVDNTKIELFNKIKLPWIEVDGEEILKNKIKMIINPLRDNFKKEKCDICRYKMQ